MRNGDEARQPAALSHCSRLLLTSATRLSPAPNKSNQTELNSKLKTSKFKIQIPHQQIVLPEKVDVLVSEPMGTLLVNERMLEARSRGGWGFRGGGF